MLRTHAAAIAILVAALALRLWDITARSLWMDEAVEYWVATAPLGDLASTVRGAIQDPPLYSFLLHLWMSVSSSEAWLRLLSVAFGLGSVAGAMVIGQRLQGRAAALAAGGLMAVLPTAIRYSQEIGQYAPMQCALVWSLVALLGLVREPGRDAFVRWTVIAVVAAYTYYGTVIVVLVPFACVMIEAARRRDRVCLRRGAASAAVLFLALAPLLIYFLPEQLHRGPTAGALKATDIPSLKEMIVDLGTSLHVTVAFQFTGWPCTKVPGWLTAGLFVGLVAFAFRSHRRIAVWFVATWLVYLGLDTLHLFPLGFRHSNILTALIVPLAACAAFSGGRVRQVTGAALFALLCILCVVSLPTRSVHERVHGGTACAWPETEDMEKVTRYWRDHRVPGQRTYVYYGAAPAFAYYADRLGVERVSQPPDWFQHCWRGEDAAWCRSGLVFYGKWMRSLDPGQKVASIFETLGGTPAEFWIILGHAKGGEALEIGEELLENYGVVDYLEASDASAVLVRRRAP